MTIRRRYYLSLLIVLALFFANLVAYFWSARARQRAESEWNRATACELRLSSIRQELDNLNKEVTLASQIQEEDKGAPYNDETRRFFEKKTQVEEQEIEALLAEAPADQLSAIGDFHKTYIQLRDAWLGFYRTGGKDVADVTHMVTADSLAIKIFEQQLPSLQSRERDRINRARVQFQQAETLGWRVMVTTFFLSVLIAFAWSWRLSQHLTFGFSTLKHGAHLIGDLELEHRIQYPTRDEFQELAESFNEMAERLSSSRRKLLRTHHQLSESEARNRNIVDRAVYGIYRSTPDGRFLDANPALINMLGYSSKLELLNLDMSCDVYSNPRDYKMVIDALKKAGSIEGFEVQWKTKTGETIITRLSGNVIVSNGEISECEMIAENVTEHRALEEQLRQAQKMEAVGRLAGGIAHDFNNLLTVIKGHSELLNAELRAGEQARKEVEGVIRAADRAVSLTRQLLAFSRRQLLNPKIVDLNTVVSNMEKMLARLLGEDIQLTTKLALRAGLIKADPNQIEQVIMNLAVNARDAMPTGGRLCITTSRLEIKNEFRHGEMSLDPGSYIMLSVIDTGEGMDAATASRVFEPFFTTKEQGKGTGLGLSTVYGIVKQSEGEIWVASEPGKGAAFYICFPRVMEKTESLPEARPVEHASGKETILIVEDENDVRDVASTMLRRRGYNVVPAATAGEAEKLCQTHAGTIHLLLTDVVLKETGGLQLAQRLTALRPEMRVIYMSGYTDDVVLQHGIRNSQVAFLPKPFTTEELTSKVREVLDRVVTAST
jgi:two-component system, cell cycle sensor histidine kinase and response regulator CckA